MLVSQLLKKHRDCVEESRVGTVGESTCLSSIWPAARGFDFLTYRPMWTEFVGSLLCSKVFSRVLRVLPLTENKYLILFVVSTLSKGTVLG